eukprot:6199091-Pleurochrysis_carterae.AAC.4
MHVRLLFFHYACSTSVTNRDEGASASAFACVAALSAHPARTSRAAERAHLHPPILQAYACAAAPPLACCCTSCRCRGRDDRLCGSSCCTKGAQQAP